MSRSNGVVTGPSRNLVVLLLGLAVLAVVAFAILHRSAGFVITAEAAGQTIMFDFADDRIDLTTVLDRLLSEEPADDADAASNRDIVESVLQKNNFYYIPSLDAATAIRRISESESTQEFMRAVRAILYDLRGPFSRPATFMEADDRLVKALNDLYEENPASPLLTELWEMSIELKGMFSLRRINVTIKEDESLPAGIAGTCVGSILLDHAGLIIVDHGPAIQTRLERGEPCTAASSERLLSGERITVSISSGDMRKLTEGTTIPDGGTLGASLIPLPRSLSNYVQ